MTIKRNVLANYFGAGWTALMTFAFVPFYIRYLGIEAYGLIGVYTMLQAWFSLLDLGMTPALSRDFAGLGMDAGRGRAARDLLRSVEVIAIGIAVIVALFVWAISHWLATAWLSSKGIPTDVLAQAFAIMGVVIGLRFVENIYRSSVVGLQRQVTLSMVTSGVATLRGLGAVGVLVFVSPTIQAYFAWQCVVSLFSVMALATVAYNALPKDTHRASFSVVALRTIWRFAAGSMLITVLSLMLTQVDKILLSRLLTLKDFGYYAFAVVVAQMPLALVGPVTQAFFPRFAELHKQGNESGLANAYHAACQLIVVLLGSATVLMLLFGREILQAWTGDYAMSVRVYPLVAVISIGSLFNGLTTIPYYLQLSHGWTGLTIRVNLVAIAIVVPTLFWIVPMYGSIGAAWVWVCLNVSYVLVIIPLMHRRLLVDEKWRWIVHDVVLPLASGALTGLVLNAVVPDYRGLPATLLKLLLCFAAVSIATTLAAPVIRAQLQTHASAWLSARKS